MHDSKQISAVEATVASPFVRFVRRVKDPISSRPPPPSLLLFPSSRLLPYISSVYNYPSFPISSLHSLPQTVSLFSLGLSLLRPSPLRTAVNCPPVGPLHLTSPQFCRRSSYTSNDGTWFLELQGPPVSSRTKLRARLSLLLFRFFPLSRPISHRSSDSVHIRRIAIKFPITSDTTGDLI